MKINEYKAKYGEETPGRFRIVSPDGEFIYQIPLWVEKVFLAKLKSKKFRIQKKVMKKQIMDAINRGLKYGMEIKTP